MKRTAMAITMMVGATFLAQYVRAQPPGGPGQGGPPNPLLQAFDIDPGRIAVARGYFSPHPTLLHKGGRASD